MLSAMLGRTAILFFGVLAVYAQTNRGSISGVVKDESGAVVPGASVVVTNAGTNESRRTTSSGSGTFSVQDLEPVTYNIVVEVSGFQKESVEGVKVDTAAVASVVLTLKTGTVDTQVTVSAEAVTVNTESGTTSSTVTERQIQDVPLLNRSVLDLALTQPNVTGDAGSENPVIVTVTTCPGCNLSLNGGRPLNTLIMADGTNNTGVSLSRTMVSFTPETVQEFTIQTSAYSAEYGGTGGGVINATTKSGTNEYRGTALWYNRNPNFSAGPFTQASTNRPVPTLKYNQFHISLGGPVTIPKLYKGRNRTFFFAAWEPQYRRDHLDQYGLLPTDGMRQGDFSGLVNTASGWLPQSVVDQFKSIAPAAALTASDSVIYQNYSLANGNQFVQNPVPAAGQTYIPFPNNAIPKTMLDASALKALQFIAPAGAYYLNSNGLISNAFLPRLLKQDDKRLTIRIDEAISATNRFYFRYTSTPIIKTQYTPVSITTGGADYSYAKQAMIADTHNFSPRLINDLRLNYTRGRFSNTTSPEYDATTGQNLNTFLGLPNITAGGVPGLGGLFPGSSLGGGGSTATGIGGGGSTNVEDREERYALTDLVYWQRGGMSWKFGVDISHALQNVIPLFAALGGQYAFSNVQTSSIGTTAGTGGSPFASFLLGVPNGNVTLRSTLIPYYYRWNSLAAFAQNDWKVKPNLTLNLGVRYNLELPRTEKYDNQGVFRPDLAAMVSLPAPLALASGRVVTSTLEPPFVFSGHGNSRYLTPASYLEFEPRFGFAWSPGFLQAKRVTLRGGYGLSHAPVTGAIRLRQPDFGATQPFATTVPSSTVNPNYVMRLGENPPVIAATTPAQAINAPSNGLVTANSLYYQAAIGGYAISPNYHTPYVQNWNFTIAWQAAKTTTVEIAYVGNKGTHLFLPHENINPKDIPLIQAQNAAGVNTTNTINDPLGRLNPATGRVLTVQNGSLGSPYLGFSSLNVLYDSAANSIRHAGYINMVHRVTRGLTLTSNYTYGKSIDDASSAGGDKNILTAVNGQVDGQIAFGGTRRNDRSVSTYDMRHVINTTYIWDLPFGRGRAVGAHLFERPWGKALDFAVGGWTTSGQIRFSSGFPAMVTLADTNQLGDLTHTARPDLVAGVPIINPLWSRDCPTGGGCQPYLNPSAFERPAVGALGTAPRTLDGARGPWDQFFDASIQKNFSLGEKRRIQFRVDFLNAFNHPVFRVYPNNAGGTDLFNGAPSTAALSAADYNTWAMANNQPLAATPGGMAQLNQINAMVNQYRAGGTAAGALPLNFFTIPLPANFWGTQAGAFNLTTLDGFKLFRLRQQFNNSGGDLYQSGTPRYIQFGIKLYF
jgi:hypothetical protein